MAWTNQFGATAGVSKTASTSVTSGTGGAFAAGTVIMVFVATDNTATANGQTSEVSSVTDTKGNTYTKIIEFCNSQAAAGAGATVSVWYSKITIAVTTTDTYTANFANSVTAKAISVNYFTVSAGATISVVSSATLANNALDPGAMSITGLVSGEYLFVRAVALERPSTGTWTVTTGYTAINTGATTGGGAATNMEINGEIRIFTGTGDTSDPTATAVDSASVYFALKEQVSVTTNKAVSAVSTPTFTIAKSKVYGKIATLAATPTFSLLRSIAKPRTIPVSLTVPITWSLTKTYSSLSNLAFSVQRSTSKPRSITTTPTFSMLSSKAYGKVASIASALTFSLIKAGTKALGIASTPGFSVARGIAAGRIFTISSPVAFSIQRSMARVINSLTTPLFGIIKTTLMTPTRARSLVKNGTFDTDVSGWSALVGSIAWSAGKMLVTVVGGGGQAGAGAVGFIEGQYYLVSADMTASVAGMALVQVNGSISVLNALGSGTVGSIALVRYCAPGNGTAVNLYLTASNGSTNPPDGSTATFDNVRIQQLGDELLTNPNIDDATGWTAGAGVTFSGGAAQASGANLIIAQFNKLIPGRTYAYEVTSTTTTTGVNLRICNADSGVNGVNIVAVWPVVRGGGAATNAGTFVATQAAASLEADAQSFTGSIDRFSIKEVGPDSIITTPLAVVRRSVPKTATAYGTRGITELVADPTLGTINDITLAGGATYAASTISIPAAGSGYARFAVPGTSCIGRKYRVTVAFTGDVADMRVQGGSVGSPNGDGNFFSGASPWSFDFTASFASETFDVARYAYGGATGVFVVSNLSVKELPGNSIARAVGSIRSIAVTPAFSRLRALTKALTVATTSAFSASKTQSKPLTIATTSTFTIARVFSKSLAFVIASTPLATLQRAVALARSIASTLAPAGARSISTARTVLSTPTITMIRAMVKVRSIASTLLAATTQAFQGGGKTVSVASTPTFNVLRSSLKVASISSTPAFAMLRSTVKALAIVITPATSLAKLLAKVRAIQSTPLPSATRGGALARSIASTLLPSTSRSALKVATVAATLLGTVSRAMQAVRSIAVTPVAALARAVGRVFGIATTPAFTALRSPAKVSTVASTPVPAAMRAPAKVINVTTTPTFSLAAIKSLFRTFTIAVTPAFTFISGKALVRLASIATTPTFTIAKTNGRQRIISIATTPVAAFARVMSKLASIASTSIAAAARSSTRAIALAVTPLASAMRGVPRSASIATTATPIVSKSAAKIHTILSTPVATVTRSAAKLASIAANGLASVTRSISRAIAAASSPVGSALRSVARSLSIAVMPLATVARQQFRGVVASIATTAVPAASRAISRTLGIATTSAPRAIKTLFRTVAVAVTPLATRLGQMLIAVITPTRRILALLASKLANRTLTITASTVASRTKSLTSSTVAGRTMTVAGSSAAGRSLAMKAGLQAGRTMTLTGSKVAGRTLNI